MNPIRLTQTVKKGGCAAKIPAAHLHKILASIPTPEARADILVDGRFMDDAAITRMSDTMAAIHTLDFFTPIVDSPLIFGEVAAANALSDVYAMGGIPQYCLAILAFPAAELDENAISDLMKGASRKILEAKAALVGGHSIDDETLKFGLSVHGRVPIKNLWTNAKAQMGDDLILTKALGTGTLCAGLKHQSYCELDIQEALDSMTLLNNVPELLSDEMHVSIHAATDITGFGLAGHSMQMAKASDKSFSFDTDSIPLFSKTLESLGRNNLTRAHRTNAEYTKPFISAPLDPLRALTVFDPQTSGGLLLSVDPSRSHEIVKTLEKRFPATRIIGRCHAQEVGKPLVFFG